MRQQYVAILEGEPGSEYSVFVPDFPGFASAGDTQAEAYKNTAEGLTGHIALMVEEGEDIPLPTLLDQIEIEPDTLVAATFLVDVAVPGKSRRFNLTLPEYLVKEVDRVAGGVGHRSRFFAQAAQKALKEHDPI